MARWTTCATHHPGNQVEEGEPNLAERFRRASGQLARMYAICSSSGKLADYRADIAFFEEIRVWMARFDAEERKARGEAMPPDIELYLKSLAAGAIEAGGVTDTYAAAGIGRPDLSHLDDAFIAWIKRNGLCVLSDTTGRGRRRRCCRPVSCPHRSRAQAGFGSGLPGPGEPDLEVDLLLQLAADHVQAVHRPVARIIAGITEPVDVHVAAHPLRRAATAARRSPLIDGTRPGLASRPDAIR